MSLRLVTVGVLLLGGTISAVKLGFGEADAQTPPLTPSAANIYLDRGAAGLTRCLTTLSTRASVLMITAHPDDEDGGLLAYQTRGLGARGALMTLTRGEGGQNAMSTDIYDALGLMRTQELLTAGQYYGVDQYWGRVIDYGFSKTREEALQKWGYERVLSDVVRVVRMTRPLILTSVFIGAPTDGHGNHQVAGQMAQEAFVAAGDPSRFPEQIKEGLRPWSPLKVYERVPFFTPTKENTIYDYATDKYVPIRFFNYINKTWITQKPSTTIEFPEGEQNPASGLTYAQMGREGWGFQKSQNGGGTLPQPSIVTTFYHRYGSKIEAADREKSFYDGIDVSLNGIASLESGDTRFVKEGLAEILKCVGAAQAQFNPTRPSAIAPQLADGLKGVRELLKKVRGSELAEPGKDDVAFELESKERQFEKALVLALGLSFDSAVGPEREPTGPFAAFGGPAVTFTIAIPGQQFTVQGNLYNQGPELVNLASITIEPSDGKDWSFKPDKETPSTLAGGKDVRLRFAVKAPESATITKPYYSRPDQEQPYYDLQDERFRNASLAPYPLLATARLSYRGEEFAIRKVVQTYQRLEGIGLVEQPLLMGPPVSVSVYPAAGAVPTSVKAFNFSCVLHSNAKGPADGVLRLKLPGGWESTPAEHPFHIARDGENETVNFEVLPHSVAEGSFEIKAVAEYKGKSYEDGYRMTGYPGLRPYPYYRPAAYKAVGVNVQTAPNLNVGFFPGTGDEVPRALQDLGLNVQILSGGDIENGTLKNFDAIVLGVRAYAVRPELRAANNRLLEYVKGGGVVVVQYNLQNFDRDYGPYPFTLGSNPEKVVDESSAIHILDAKNPALTWPNPISEADFKGWEEERGHGFMQKWDPHYQALVETHDPDQKPQAGGLLMARYGKGFYVYDAFALYRQLPAGVPGAYRLLANLVSLGKNPEWK